MTIKLTKNIFYSGTELVTDSIHNFNSDIESDLVKRNSAVFIGRSPVFIPNGGNHIAYHREIGNPIWQCGIPFVLPPGNGSSSGLQFSGINGEFTLSSAIVSVNISHSYIYMPENFGGSSNPAGWYYALWSSSTAGILYLDTYDPTSNIAPLVPKTPSIVPVNLSGWITSPITEIQACQFIIPGNFMGNNGLLEALYRLWCNNSSGNKTIRIKFDTTTMHSMAPTTSSYNNDILAVIQNSGEYNKQVNTRNGLSLGTGTTSVDGDVRAVDTSVDVYCKMTMQIPATTDGLIAILRMVRITGSI